MRGGLEAEIAKVERGPSSTGQADRLLEQGLALPDCDR